MRQIKHIVLHCTATDQKATVESIMRYWFSPKPKGNGWKTPGYHYLIDPAGYVHNLVPIEKPSNGVAGHNEHSIHISYIGGIDKKGKPIDNRTPQQIEKQIELLRDLKQLFPDAEICGHRDFLKPGPKWKDCPSFDVKEWLKTIKL